MPEPQSQPIQAEDGQDRSGADYWDKRNRPETHASEGSLTTAVRRLYGRKYDRMIKRLLDRMPDGGSLLELGCAPGWFLGRVHRLRPDLRLSGIDYAPVSVENTRAYLADIGVEAHIENGDLRDYVAEGALDGVISSGLVEHFDDPAPIIAHHARIAGPGAWVLVSVPNFRTWALRRGFEWLSPADFATHNLAVMDRPALAALMRGAELEQVASGWAGGAALYATPRQRPRGLALAYLMLAKAWNVVAALIPDALSPWHAYYWAVGRVPESRG